MRQIDHEMTPTGKGRKQVKTPAPQSPPPLEPTPVTEETAPEEGQAEDQAPGFGHGGYQRGGLGG